MTAWDPDAYAAFRAPRLRPALDLLAQVGDLPDGAVVDLGCGDGAVGGTLRVRAGTRRLLGVDASAAMLERAAATGTYDALICADIGGWRPAAPPALIFSNAVLHWLDDHGRLLPRLARGLAPGGVLAVQMPANHAAPSHALMHRAARATDPARIAPDPPAPPVWPLAAYDALLSPFGRLAAWETTYLQHLDPAPDGSHPVRRFTESTGLRPWLDRLDPALHPAFLAAYEADLARAYPPGPDGRVRFPFTRRFLVLQVPGCPR